jgi:hypothetical protein
MSETRTGLSLGEMTALLWRHERNRVPIWRCATCDVNRPRRGARDIGFCGDCLDRSRVLDGDDLGGEG